jgi:hypothetical protein
VTAPSDRQWQNRLELQTITARFNAAALTFSKAAPSPDRLIFLSRIAVFCTAPIRLLFELRTIEAEQARSEVGPEKALRLEAAARDKRQMRGCKLKQHKLDSQAIQTGS